MSSRTSGIIYFNCGFDHGQMEPCHGHHEIEVVLHNTSDTVTIRMDDERIVMSDPGFCALEDAIQKLK